MRLEDKVRELFDEIRQLKRQVGQLTISMHKKDCPKCGGTGLVDLGQGMGKVECLYRAEE